MPELPMGMILTRRIWCLHGLAKIDPVLVIAERLAALNRIGSIDVSVSVL
jgi:hypothetical protein